MLKVLIAEDDLMMIADLRKKILVDGGYKVCGIARTVPEAAPWLSFTSLILPYSISASPTVVSAPLGRRMPLDCLSRSERRLVSPIQAAQRSRSPCFGPKFATWIFMISQVTGYFVQACSPKKPATKRTTTMTPMI
jgi:hypothetical protein